MWPYQQLIITPQVYACPQDFVLLIAPYVNLSWYDPAAVFVCLLAETGRVQRFNWY